MANDPIEDSQGDPATKASEDQGAKPLRAGRRWRWLVAFAALWLLGDFAYSRYVAYRVSQWEAAVPWTSEGLAPDAAEFEIGQGDTALLMVHGFSDSPQMYRKLAPALAEEGYFCRAILLPGFGKDVEAYASGTIDEWHQKVASEVAQLRKEHARVWIVAHSLGGAITIAHTLDNRSEVDGLVLITPAIAVSNERSPLLPTRFWHEFSKYVLPFTHTTCSPFEMDAQDPAERNREYRNVFSPRSVVDQTFELIDHNSGRASEIRKPTLMFLSESDQVVDSAAIATYFQELSAKPKELVRLSNSGHMVPVDYEWALVVDRIAEFIRNQDPTQEDATQTNTDQR